MPDLINTTVALQIQVNTTHAAVTETSSISGSGVTLELPAGPFLRVVLQVTALDPIMTRSGPGTSWHQGTFFFQQQTTPGPPGWVVGGTFAADDEVTSIVAMAGVVVTIAGTQTLTDGEGAFVIVTSGPNQGVAGYVKGKAAVAAAVWASGAASCSGSTRPAPPSTRRSRSTAP